jgi:polyferredoxin
MQSPGARTSIPAAPPPKIKLAPIRPSRMSRRRAAVLVLVHLVVLAHVAHWWLTGRSVTPVEPSEAHEALTYGVINAGLILLALSVLSTLVLGRWFCGWACHVVALQDLCAWLLGKVGLRPRPVRARVLMLVPVLAAVDVFLLPRILRWIDGQPFPGVRAELTTDALWETFPGPWMAALTLLVDGFLIVYLLGGKAFCTYGCPYGALYGFADRFSRGRIRVSDACEGCGHCTATCSSNVDVRAEVARFGMVVDTGCMKCMDCVSVCPKDALFFSFVGPPPARARGKKLRPTRVWDFTWTEEALMAVAFLGAVFAFRGLYDAVPLLLAIGIAVIVAFAAALWLRLALRKDVSFQGRELKRGGRFRGAGLVAMALTPSLFAFTLHSGVVQAERRLGERALARANAMAGAAEGRRSPEYPAAMRGALAHLEQAADWGFRTSAELHHKLGSLCVGLAEHEPAQSAELLERGERHLRAALARDGELVYPRLRLAEVLILGERIPDAVDQLAEALAREPELYAAAELAYDLVALHPELPGPRLLVVDYLVATGDVENARNALAPLLEHIPDHPQVTRRAAALEAAEERR